MRLGLFRNGWWQEAARSLNLAHVDLPIAEHASGNAYAADIEARVVNSVAITEAHKHEPVDLFLDNSGTGLTLSRDVATSDSIKLMHEALGKPLCSHFIDPITTSFQGLDFGLTWQCLHSQHWIKAYWDKAGVTELLRMGIPNVVHLPMAAPVREYDTRPLDPRECKHSVSFVGGQNTSFFSDGGSAPKQALLPGLIAHFMRESMSASSFYEAYHDAYRFDEPINASDDMATRVNKAVNYFNNKLFYHAAMCIRNRDRFVVFLKQQLGDMFRLVGTRWDAAYGVPCEPPLGSINAYFQHFRDTAININLVNGNAETGLNMRHFEITAAGGFMLCFDQPELAEQFVIGKECVSFTSEQDLIDKIHYYLANPDERYAIAFAGQRRTLSQHLYSHRLQSVLSLFKPKPAVEFSSSNCDADFKRLLPDPEIILDCGANVGQMARGLRRIYPKVDIYSFEPVAAVFNQLEIAAKELRLHTVKKAVGDRDGRTTINLTVSPEANSLLGYQADNPCAKWTQITGAEEIEICTLDRWCTDNNIDPRRVGLLKLDVQGAELQALIGARNLLKHVKLIYLEVAFVPIYRDCPLLADIDRYLNECRFTRYALYPSDQPHNWGDALYVRREENRA